MLRKKAVKAEALTAIVFINAFCLLAKSFLLKIE